MQVWNYFKLSSDNNPQQTATRKFRMHHTKNDGTTVEMGICEAGPFRPATVSGDCSELMI